LTKNSFTLDPAPQRNRTQDNMRHRTSTQRVALSSLDALNKLQAIISGSTWYEEATNVSHQSRQFISRSDAATG